MRTGSLGTSKKDENVPCAFPTAFPMASSGAFMVSPQEGQGKRIIVTTSGDAEQVIMLTGAG
jgi:hypothetical protein